MISRGILILSALLTVLFTSYCVHKQTNGERGVSGEASNLSTETITKSTPIGEWRFETYVPAHPPHMKVIEKILVRCKGESDFREMDDLKEIYPIQTFHTDEYPFSFYPFISQPTNWGELEGTRTYRTHRAAERNNDLKSVVFLKFFNWAVDVDFTTHDPESLQESEDLQQLVLDLQLVCPLQ